jgi:hypothetical protein
LDLELGLLTKSVFSSCKTGRLLNLVELTKTCSFGCRTGCLLTLEIELVKSGFHGGETGRLLLMESMMMELLMKRSCLRSRYVGDEDWRMPTRLGLSLKMGGALLHLVIHSTCGISCRTGVPRLALRG